MSETRHHGIGSLHSRGQGLAVAGVRLRDRCSLRRGRRVADDRDNVQTCGEGMFDGGPAGAAGRSDDGDTHHGFSRF
jgi:hypothetical protein